MKKKALRKDFYMEIRTSLGRFLSIFFIVAIGVAFFSGIRSAEPDMRLSADAYFDENNLMDIQVVSTLGLTEEDKAALEQVEGIEYVEAGYSVDALCIVEDSKKVVHISSILPSMNEVTVEEGRMPEAENECLVDANFLAGSEYEIGDEITFLSGTSADLLDTLKTDTFTIVGSASSPCYISLNRGSTTIGNGSISGFVSVPEESFDMDVYTELYASVEGAKELTVFTDAYDEKIEKTVESVDEIRGERETARYEELIGDANAEVEKAEKELEDARAEADEKLNDAKKQLDDGRTQLEDGKKELSDGYAQLEDAKNQLNEKQAEVTEGYSQLESAKKELDDNQTNVTEGYTQLAGAKKELDEKQAEVTEGYAKLESAKAQLNEKQTEIANIYAQIEEQEAQLNTWFAAYDKVKAYYDSLVQSGWVSEEILQPIETELQKIEDAIASAKSMIAMAKQMIAEGQQEIDDGYEEIAKNQVDLDEAQKQLNAGCEEISKNQADLDAAQQQIDEGRTQISQTQAKLDEGQQQIDAVWTEIKASQAELDAAQAEVDSKEKELSDAEAEYEKARVEADEQLEEGERKIQDAKNEISKIEHAKWYVNDRSTLPEHSGYGDNADRMKAIGEVFPVLFFLVAALISLTTMTRMVEEQRTLIGTLKALGYGRRSIAGKYLGYAFLATVAGSVVGILIGEKILPYIIITAYGIIYPYMQVVRVPYNMYYGLMASLAALACTLGATFFSCFKELREQAAELMRPPAPKQGKRVFMERIPFLWKQLNFIWKATVRNLIRYKKRFFMTVFGIGGSMALLMVGFGLEDSIFNIGVLQYGELQLYDGNVILEEDATSAEKKASYEKLVQDERVKQASRNLLKQVELKNGKVKREAYLSVPEDVEHVSEFTVFRDRVTHESYELSDSGVIIAEKTAKMLDVEVGDTVTILDDISGEVTVTVEHICENYMGHYIYMTPALYEEAFGRATDYNALCFDMKEKYASEERSVGESVLETEGALSVSYTDDIAAQLEDMLSALDIVMIVLVISAGMLSFVVLYNLNNINITERKRELATLKVLGFYDKEVSKYVYRENVILTFIGGVVGMVLGRILHQFIIVTVEVDAAMFGRNIDFSSYVYSFLITIAFSVFVNAVMFFKLKKINMVESLKSVE